MPVRMAVPQGSIGLQGNGCVLGAYRMRGKHAANAGFGNT